MPKVIIIGGSFAGHYALTTVYQVSRADDLQVTLVSPNSHAYFNPAAPRLLVEPQNLEVALVPLEQSVKELSNGKAKYLRGTVTNVDFASKTVDVAGVDEDQSQLSYDVLIIASGTQSKWDGFKINTNHESVRDSILAVAKDLESAKYVAVIGGGPTGVETAGEIANEYRSAKVTLISGTAPLALISEKLSEAAVARLEGLNVEIVKSTATSVAQKGVEGATTSSVQLATGEKREFDIVLESYITGPYSSFLPDSVKDASGYVETDGNLVVRGQQNVLALGDIVASGSKSIVDIKMRQKSVLAKTLKRALASSESGSPVESDSSTYAPVEQTLLIPISRNGGVGLLFGYRVPSFFVKWIKAKTFMLEQCRKSFV